MAATGTNDPNVMANILIFKTPNDDVGEVKIMNSQQQTVIHYFETLQNLQEIKGQKAK